MLPNIHALLDKIKEYYSLPRISALFNRIAQHEPYLATTWRKYQAVMHNGEIDAPTKQLMGLVVAVAKTSDSMVGFQNREVRRAGLGEHELLEALAVANFFEGFDSFAHALHVDSELRPRKMAAGDMSLIDREIDVNVPVVSPPAWA